MKFHDYPISDELINSLASQGINRPTDIQYKAIPHILRGEDVLAISQTGTGKTLAFSIPIINKLYREISWHKSPRCLIMVPTHELAIQISEVIRSISKFSKLKTLAIFGGVEQEHQISQLKAGIDIVVATPGRMFDLISQGFLEVSKIRTLVLDEADHMLDLGFIKDIRDIVKKIPSNRQTLFFSATIDKKIKKLAYSLVQDAIRIQISPKDPVTKNVRHALLKCEMDDKRLFLEKLIRINEGSKILIFVRTKVRAERVKNAMLRVDIFAECIHGDKTQTDREETLQSFNSGKVMALIATDVSARGIDFNDVDIVINYDLPDNPENYIHRIGRTGRAKKKGLAISFCAPIETEMLEKIEGLIAYPIHELEITQTDFKEVMDLKFNSSKNISDIMEEIEGIEEHKRKKKKYKK